MPITRARLTQPSGIPAHRSARTGASVREGGRVPGAA